MTSQPDTTPTQGPLSRTCPRCQQPPGQQCRSATGKPLKGRTHQQRLTGSTTTPHHGQPPLLTPERQDALTEILGTGTTLTTAAQAIGIGISTLHFWIARGQSEAPEDEPYRVFREAVAQARARGSAEMARNIFDAGKPKRHKIPVMNPVTGNQAVSPEGEPLFKIEETHDWRAHTFLLERGYASEWGRRQTLEIQGDASELAAGLVGGAQADVVAARASRLIAEAVAELRARREGRELEARTVPGEVV